MQAGDSEQEDEPSDNVKKKTEDLRQIREETEQMRWQLMKLKKEGKSDERRSIRIRVRICS